MQAVDLSLDILWDDVGFSPNPNQEKAIRHTSGPLYLTAGPGSGKTRVVLWRTVNLLVFQDVAPQEIFLSTFTEKAAHQLREGLRALLNQATYYTGEHYDISRMKDFPQKELIDAGKRGPLRPSAVRFGSRGALRREPPEAR